MNAPQKDFLPDLEKEIEPHTAARQSWIWEPWAIGGLVLAASANAVYLLLTR